MPNASELLIKAIKHFLHEREKSQSWLAEEMGIGAGTISRWMTGQFEPEISQINKLAKALGIQPHELLIDYDAKPQKESREVLEAIRLLKNLKPHDLETVLRLLKTLQPVSGLLSKKE